MSRPAKVRIDADAFQHNLQIAKSRAKDSRIMAMVKANAYGHGVKSLLPALALADAVGVSCIEEAMELRENGYQQAIILLEGFFKADELELIARMQFQIVLHQRYQLEMLRQVTLQPSLKVWIKINTGMNRLGFLPDELQEIFNEIKQLQCVEHPVNVMSHFSDADNVQSTKNQKQLALFQQLSQSYDGFKSMANSAALLTNPAAHFDWVRPGIMLYGISPFSGKIGADFNLKPVMTLSSELIAVHQFKQGEAIGYSSTWVCPEDMLVGVVAMGYGDGYPRHAKSGTPVLVNGVRVPLIGRVSMDMLTVDLRHCPQAKVGASVILWGSGLPVEEIALCTDTIAYELVCHINPANVRLN